MFENIFMFLLFVLGIYLLVGYFAVLSVREDMINRVSQNPSFQKMFDEWINNLYPHERDKLITTNIQDLIRREFNRPKYFITTQLLWPTVSDVDIEEHNLQKLFEKSLDKKS